MYYQLSSTALSLFSIIAGRPTGPSSQFTRTELQSLDLARCYADVAGIRRCGTSSSMRTAGCMGSFGALGTAMCTFQRLHMPKIHQNQEPCRMTAFIQISHSMAHGRPAAHSLDPTFATTGAATCWPTAAYQAPGPRPFTVFPDLMARLPVSRRPYPTGKPPTFPRSGTFASATSLIRRQRLPMVCLVRTPHATSLPRPGRHERGDNA